MVEEATDEDDWLNAPPETVPSPAYYSVARHRARQQIVNARDCADVHLRSKRLASAIKTAALLELGDDVLETLKDDLESAESAKRAVGARDSPMLTRATLPIRPMTPEMRREQLSEEIAPGVVAILTLSDDGIAELRDAAITTDPPFAECRVFDRGALQVSSVFSFLEREAAGADPRFDYAALQEFLLTCAPQEHKSIVALVDPLRLGGQLLCSRCLNAGPQGLLCGVVAAVPSGDTPPPFSGPAYAALSALLCLGSDSAGLGGVGSVACGGVFGRALGFADRAAAYGGGWPSEGVGRLAYKVAASADLAREAGGTFGEFLFGNPKGSPEEIERAQAVAAWLRGGSQTCQQSNAWMHHFVRAGVPAPEQNSGLMWMLAGENAGRWPVPPPPPPPQEEDPDADGDAADAAPQDNLDADPDADPDTDAGADATAAQIAFVPAGVEEPDEDPAEDCAGRPPESIPDAPPTSGTMMVKHIIPFGTTAISIVEPWKKKDSYFGDTCRITEPMAYIDKTLFQAGSAEFLLVADLGDPAVLTWPERDWLHWSDECRAAKAPIVCAAILPRTSDSDEHWHSLLVVLKSFIQDFDFVFLLGDKDTQATRLSATLRALLDPSVSISCVGAHLSPFELQHFSVAFYGVNAEALLDNIDQCCNVHIPAIPEACEQTSEVPAGLLAKNTFRPCDWTEAAVLVHSVMYEYLNDSGKVIKKPEVETKPEGDDGQDEAKEGDEPDGDAAPAEDPPPDDAGAGGDGDVGAAGVDPPPAKADPAEVAAAAAAAAAAKALEDLGEAKLLAFVVGGSGAQKTIESGLTIRGSPLLDSPTEGPSLAYPACCYGVGCTAPRPWGVQWDRADVVAFISHTRAIYSVMARVVGGFGCRPGPEHDLPTTAYWRSMSALREQHYVMHLRRCAPELQALVKSFKELSTSAAKPLTPELHHARASLVNTILPVARRCMLDLPSLPSEDRDVETLSSLQLETIVNDLSVWLETIQPPNPNV